MSDVKSETNFWLAEVCQYGYASHLIDGPHSDRAGVEKAAYLIEGMGLNREKRTYCCVEVIQTPVEPKAHDANEEAIEMNRQAVATARSRGRL